MRAVATETNSTHPLTPDRIAAARDRIALLGAPDPAWQKDSDAFRRIKARYPPKPAAGKRSLPSSCWATASASGWA